MNIRIYSYSTTFLNLTSNSQKYSEMPVSLYRPSTLLIYLIYSGGIYFKIINYDSDRKCIRNLKISKTNVLNLLGRSSTKSFQNLSQHKF